MLTVLAVLFVALLITAYYVASFVVNSNVHTKPQSRFDYQESDFADYQTQDFHFTLKDGRTLEGLHISRTQPKSLIILCHGFSTNHFFSSKQALYFLSLGYDVLLYSHYQSKNYHSKKCGMGDYESEDLEEVVQYMRKRYTHIGTYGISMGGATVLLHAGNYGSVNFVISESAYASVKSELAFKYQRKLPGFGWILLPLTRLFIYLMGGYDFYKIDVAKSISHCDIPLLLIHGSLDPTVHIEDGIALSKAGKNVKNLYICNGAKHTDSYAYNPQKYEENVKNFLESIAS